MARRRGWGAVLAIAGIACLALFAPSCCGKRSDGAADASDRVPAGGSLPRQESGEVADSGPGRFLDDLSAAATASSAVLWEQDDDVASAAGGVLEAYADERGCQLVLSGYLGISDGAWGAIVQGETWVDTVYVTKDGDAALVRVVRTRAKEGSAG